VRTRSADLLRSLETREKRERVESFDLDEALDEARRAPRAKPAISWSWVNIDSCAVTPPIPKPWLDSSTVLNRGCSLPTRHTGHYDASWRDGVYNALGPAERTYMRVDGQPDADDATGAPGGAHGRKRGNRQHNDQRDTRVDWSEAFELVPSLAVGYIWHAGVHAAEVAAGLERIGFEIVSQVIWTRISSPWGGPGITGATSPAG